MALVTGGGSGIGLEICTEFGKHGALIAIMGRRRSVLDAAVSTLKSIGISVSVYLLLSFIYGFLLFGLMKFEDFKVW